MLLYILLLNQSSRFLFYASFRRPHFQFRSQIQQPFIFYQANHKYNNSFKIRKMVKINFKCTQKELPYTMDLNFNIIPTVLKLKEDVSKRTGDLVINIKLFYNKKLMKDDNELLKNFGFADDDKIVAVIRREDSSRLNSSFNSDPNSSYITENLPYYEGFGYGEPPNDYDNFGFGFGGFGPFGSIRGLFGQLLKPIETSDMFGPMTPDEIPCFLNMMTKQEINAMIEKNSTLKKYMDLSPILYKVLETQQLLAEVMKPQVARIKRAKQRREREQRRLEEIKQRAEKELRDGQKLYKKQLEQLRMFGFNSQVHMIKALINTSGDIDGAIERLLTLADF